jgi:hypothetical protein
MPLRPLWKMEDRRWKIEDGRGKRGAGGRFECTSTCTSAEGCNEQECGIEAENDGGQRAFIGCSLVGSGALQKNSRARELAPHSYMYSYTPVSLRGLIAESVIINCEGIFMSARGEICVYEYV